VATGNDLVEFPMRANALCRTLVRGVPGVADGGVLVSDAPGLGVTLDPQVVETYRYPSNAIEAPTAT
jgi:L-alanine-DL-glutamate epimerase-like enolase superfamily enzyme